MGSADLEAQTLLLNSGRDVGAALAELLQQVKVASSTIARVFVFIRYSLPQDDALLDKLKAEAKVTVFQKALILQNLISSITSLLKTVKSVEDLASRGLRALENALEATDQELQQLNQYILGIRV